MLKFPRRKVVSLMLDFSWELFSITGCVDTYLLIKEIERDDLKPTEEYNGKLEEIDIPNH